MAEFVQHESCPRCGSRDNLGRYSDGSAWCFGCHYLVRGGVSNSADLGYNREDRSDIVRLPADVNTDFPTDVVNWLSKYDFKIEETLKWKWCYSPFKHQLIFPFYGDGELLAWQARNFAKAKPKYYTEGDVNAILPIFHGLSTTRTLVVVEDCVSAAKIARQSDAMPLLGSHLPAKKLNRLRPFYERLIVWLDSDKYKEACHMADLAKWIGFFTKVVYTDLDPKEYSDEHIQKQCFQM